MKFNTCVFTAAAIGLAGMSTLAQAETWRVGLEETKTSVQYAYAEAFKKQIEAKSDGDITVQLLPYGKWGSTYSALYDAVQNGAIQIGFGSGALGGTVPESQLLSLNFVMPSDQWKTAQVLNSPAFLESKPWQEAFAKRGLKPRGVRVTLTASISATKALTFSRGGPKTLNASLSVVVIDKEKGN